MSLSIWNGPHWTFWNSFWGETSDEWWLWFSCQGSGSDACGWWAALIAVLCYGSFGVPVRDTKHISVHPLVLQSLKTITFFFFAWCIVVPFMISDNVDTNDNNNTNSKIQWTWWGLLSGALWVTGGTGGIYGIRNVGLAMAVGIWASIMILMNFIWGIGIFREPVSNLFETVLAFVLLTAGVVGMSHFSSSTKLVADKKKTSFKYKAATTRTTAALLLQQQQQQQRSFVETTVGLSASTNTTATRSTLSSVVQQVQALPKILQNCNNKEKDDRDIITVLPITTTCATTMTMTTMLTKNATLVSSPSVAVTEHDENDDDEDNTFCCIPPVTTAASNTTTSTLLNRQSSQATNTTASSTTFCLEGQQQQVDNKTPSVAVNTDAITSFDALLVATTNSKKDDDDNDRVVFCCCSGTVTFTLTRRTAGILGAVANGILSGSSLIPLHYAKKQGLGGARYIPSFATGSLIANVVLWALIFVARYQKSCRYTWKHEMPSWKLDRLLWPGVASGTLMSVGMLGSILATTYLGQGIGNSVVQSKILISGLWGILYFGEVQGIQRQLSWFASASLSIAGIILLSYQRTTAAAAAATQTKEF